MLTGTARASSTSRLPVILRLYNTGSFKRESDELVQLLKKSNTKAPPTVKRLIQNALSELSQQQYNTERFYQTLNKLDQQKYVENTENEYYSIMMTRILENFKCLQQDKNVYSSTLIEHSLNILKNSKKFINRSLFLHNGKQHSLQVILMSINHLLIESEKVKPSHFIHYLELLNWYGNAVQSFHISAFRGNLDSIKRNIIRRIDRLKCNFLLNYNLSRGDYYAAIEAFKIIYNQVKDQSMEIGFDAYHCRDFDKLINLAMEYREFGDFRLLLGESERFGKSISLTSQQMTTLYKKSLYANQLEFLDYLVFKYSWLLDACTLKDLSIIIESHNVSDACKVFRTFESVLNKSDDVHTEFLIYFVGSLYIDTYLSGEMSNTEAVKRILEFCGELNTNIKGDDHKEQTQKVIERLFDTVIGDLMTSKQIETLMSQCILGEDLAPVIRKHLLLSSFLHLLKSERINPKERLRLIRNFIRDAYANGNQELGFQVAKSTILDKHNLLEFLKKVQHDHSYGAGALYEIHQHIIRPVTSPQDELITTDFLISPFRHLNPFINERNVWNTLYVSGVKNAISIDNERLIAYYFYHYFMHSIKSLSTKIAYDLHGKVFDKMFLAVVFEIKYRKFTYEKKQAYSSQLCNLLSNLHNIMLRMEFTEGSFDKKKHIEEVRKLYIVTGFGVELVERDSSNLVHKSRKGKGGPKSGIVRLKEFTIPGLNYSASHNVMSALSAIQPVSQPIRR